MPTLERASQSLGRAGQLASVHRDGSASSPYDTDKPADTFTFRDYTLVPRSRQLRRNRQDLEIGGRAFDLLTLLVSSRGEIVSKEQILAYVWPSMVVEESNLRFQMAALRKVLGHDRELIKTIPGRGYIFVVDDTSGEPDTETGGLMVRHSDVPEAEAVGQDYDPQGLDRAALPFETPPDVVVIDDDESVREALMGLLDFAGLTVEAHRSVQAFLETQPRAKPKCLILDVWLPGRSGLDFQADLLNSDSETPVIFISGHADIHMSVRAMKAGAVDFLTKPLRHEELLAAVQSVVGREALQAFG